MVEAVWNVLWANFIQRWFLFGKRWILTPILLLLALFLALLVSLGLDDFLATLANPYFAAFSVVIVVGCVAWFLIATRRPPPKDSFTVAVASFRPVSESEDVKNEAAMVQRRITEAIEQRMHDYGIGGSVKPRREMIDDQHLSSKDAEKQAAILSRHHQAHTVVYGSVGKDQEYYLRPRLYKRDVYPYELAPTGASTAYKFGPDAQGLLEFKKQRVSEVASLVALVCGMASLHESRYGKAQEIFESIVRSSDTSYAQAWFYLGFASLKLEDFKRALACFVKTYREKPDFVFAYTYTGITLQKLGRPDLAENFFKFASELAAGLPSERTDENLYLATDLIKGVLEDLDELSGRQAALSEKAGGMLDSFEHYVRGTELLEKGDNEGAVEAFDSAIECERDYADAWAYRGLALAKLERIERASEALARANELDGNHRVLAQAYAVLDDKPNALIHLSIAVKQDPAEKISATVREEFEWLRDDEDFKELTDFTEEDSKKLDELNKRMMEDNERTVEEAERLKEVLRRHEDH